MDDEAHVPMAGPDWRVEPTADGSILYVTEDWGDECETFIPIEHARAIAKLADAWPPVLPVPEETPAMTTTIPTKSDVQRGLRAYDAVQELCERVGRAPTIDDFGRVANELEAAAKALSEVEFHLFRPQATR